MYYDHESSASLPPPRSSWTRATKFRERLSQITIAPPNGPSAPVVEKSQFSPDSPPGRPSTSHNRMASSSTIHLHKTPRALESGVRQLRASRSTGVMGRINAFLESMRNWGRTEPEIMPIQEPMHLEPWPPLNVEKRPHICRCEDPKRRKRRRIWTILLIIVLLYLLANTVVLNIHVLTISSSDGKSPSQSSGTPSSSSSNFALSSNQQQCLTQFTVNAPSNPSSYPCASCLPLLQQVPASFSETDAQDGQNVQNALQFCGLKALFDSSDSAGQQSLTGGHWVQDTKFCAWSGVSCDGTGLVATLQLNFPAVPASIPDEIGALMGLQNLQIVGNGQIPGGSLPGSFTNLTSMTTLHLESTGMTALPDNFFSVLKNMISLTLVKNTNFGGGLPSSISGASLQSLVINGQTLSTSLTNLLSSTTLQKSLQILDLSSTGLSTAIPSSISSFSSLAELHLDSNNLQPPIPPTFPASLSVLTLSNNTALSGSLPASLCSSTVLKTCTLTQTGLGAGGACGPCKFS